MLLLAPHFDDAALSCSALLDRPAPVEVTTVFAGVPRPPLVGSWDRVCGFADSDESVAVRRAEEEAALAGSGGDPTFLPLLEHQYAEQRRGDEAAAIVAHVREWAEREGGLVAIPAGAGWGPTRVVRRLARALGRARIPPRHPDHILIRDAVLQAWRLGGTWTPLLYEEFPYLNGGRASSPGESIELDLAIDRERKAARIANYVSQVPHISPPGLEVDDPNVLPASERYWLLTG